MAMKPGQFVTTHVLTDAHYRAIGRVVTEWSRLERRIDQGLWALMGVTQASGHLMSSYVNFRTRLQLLRKYAENAGIDEANLEELKELTKEIVALGDDRNRLAHSLWVSKTSAEGQDQEGAVRLIYKRGKTEPEGEIVNISEIDSTADKIEPLMRAFVEWMKRHSDYPPPGR